MSCPLPGSECISACLTSVFILQTYPVSHKNSHSETQISIVLLQYYYKGSSKNVNIFMSVLYKQYTFSEPLPPPLQVYRSTFWGSKIWVSHSITFIVQQQKLALLSSLFDM